MKDTIDYTLWECSRRDMGELRYCRSIVLITGDRDFAREIRNIKRYMIGAEKTGKHGACQRVPLSCSDFIGLIFSGLRTAPISQ